MREKRNFVDYLIMHWTNRSNTLYFVFEFHRIIVLCIDSFLCTLVNISERESYYGCTISKSIGDRERRGINYEEKKITEERGERLVYETK